MSWIDLGDISLHYELAGSGPSLVLLHELGGSLDSFDGLMPALTSRFTVLRFDQRGAGLSEKPRRAFSIDDQALDLARLANAVGLEPPYRLVGIAAASGVAVSFALAQPDRVAALALCAPALGVTAEQQAYLAGRSEKATAEGMRAIVEASLGRSYPEHLRGSAYPAYRARFLANDPVSYAHANLALVEAAVESRLAEIGQPCLVLAGRHDPLRVPEEVSKVAARLPNAELALVESGHLMPVQAPDELARRLITFFLDQQGS